MAVISSSAYSEIATLFGNARTQIITAKDYFYDAVYIIVLLNSIQPSVDLLNDFWQTYLLNVDTLETTTLFLAAVRSLNNHVLFEGGYDTIDDYLVAEGITVSSAWAELSADAGYTIASTNIA